MYKLTLYACLIVAFISFSAIVFAETSEQAIKLIASCELDLNNDSNLDMALLLESTMGRELLVLMRTTNGYKAFIVSRGKTDMQLSCRTGNYIKESSAVKDNGRIYKTPGTYIQLTLPEGSAVVYFWNGKGFREVWIAD